MNIIITGASKGLGKAIGERFAAGENADALFLCSRNKINLEQVETELKMINPRITVDIYPADLSVKEEVEAFAQWFLSKRKKIDILINNAGSFLPGSVHNEPDGTLESMMHTNLYSAYYLTRSLLPAMMKEKSGHIFNMCSIASLQAYENGGAYSISKFALAGFSKNLREELKSYNIKVTAVYPGAAYTDSWSRSGVDPKRIMEAKDIADLIYASSFLSPQACVEDIIVRPQLGDL
ncbi:MAG: short chain dehydrogenase [Chitinophagaceae bacterium]|nr:short chain dehydrogenase [Chitinophagaceae bacterium]